MNVLYIQRFTHLCSERASNYRVFIKKCPSRASVPSNLTYTTMIWCYIFFGSDGKSHEFGFSIK